MIDRNQQGVGAKQSGDGRRAAEDLMHVFGGGDRARVFVQPGKDPFELLMRTVFDDRRQMTAAVMLYNKCRRLNFTRGIEDLKTYAAAQCSVGGRSTLLALQALTGILAPGMLDKTLFDAKTLKKKGAQQQKDEAVPAE